MLDFFESILQYFWSYYSAATQKERKYGLWDHFSQFKLERSVQSRYFKNILRRILRLQY